MGWVNPPRLRQYTGRVHLALSSLLIAPAKADGQPWDSGNLMPAALVARMQRGLNPAIRPGLYRTLSLGGDPLVFLAEAESWALAAYGPSMPAPDIAADILVDGRLVGQAGKVSDSFAPRWSTMFSVPLQLDPRSRIVVRAVDKDAMFDDDVGSCTIQGMPWVDDQGHVDGATIACQGQIWAMGMRVVPLDAQSAFYPPRY